MIGGEGAYELWRGILMTAVTGILGWSERLDSDTHCLDGVHDHHSAGGPQGISNV